MTQETPATASQPRSRSRLVTRVALFVSVAINLGVAGLVIGSLANRPHPEGPPRAERVGGVFSYALTHDDRREIGRAIGQEIRANRPEKDVVRAEFNSVLVALRSDPYDGAALETSMTNQLSEAMRRQAIGQRILVQHIAAMSHAERMAFADRLEAALRHPPRHGDGDKKN